MDAVGLGSNGLNGNDFLTITDDTCNLAPGVPGAVREGGAETLHVRYRCASNTAVINTINPYIDVPCTCGVDSWNQAVGHLGCLGQLYFNCESFEIVNVSP